MPERAAMKWTMFPIEFSRPFLALIDQRGPPNVSALRTLLPPRIIQSRNTSTNLPENFVPELFLQKLRGSGQ